jgi:hypothetical protein
MALSNLERQRRYISRLKAEAAIGREYLAQQNSKAEPGERTTTDKENDRV